jgi:hypothetical protein
MEPLILIVLFLSLYSFYLYNENVFLKKENKDLVKSIETMKSFCNKLWDKP